MLETKILKSNMAIKVSLKYFRYSSIAASTWNQWQQRTFVRQP